MLSKRERTAAILAGGAALLYALDSLVVTPFFDRRAELSTQAEERRLELEKSNRLFSTRRKLSKRWSESAARSITADAQAAESQLIHAVRDWASESGLSVSSLKPERTEETKQFGKITFRASGTGGMRAVSNFLWRMETATIPIRIGDVQVSSRKEGADDLFLQVGFSTIHLLAQAQNAGARSGAPSPLSTPSKDGTQ